MGLDMYLFAKKDLAYVDEELGPQIQRMFPEIQALGLNRWNAHRVRIIEFDIGYWRKANAIHAWFVKNCQDGVDDCRHYDVSREQLTSLLETCERVLGFRHLANELLSRAEGFFFGNTDYDDSYFDEIEETIRILNSALTLPESYYLQFLSSW